MMVETIYNPGDLERGTCSCCGEVSNELLIGDGRCIDCIESDKFYEKTMNYNELKDGQRVKMYVPEMNRFYTMDVTKRVDSGFTISNFDTGKQNLIGGHEFHAIVNSQEDIDSFFFITKKVTDESYQKGNDHFLKNKKAWIF